MDNLFLRAYERDQVGGEIEVGELREESSPAYRSWWIEDDDTKDNEAVPYVYTSTRDAQIIHPGLLTLIVQGDGLSDAHRAQIAGLATSLRLPENCKILKAGGIFTVIVSYGENDPVGVVTGPMRTVLTASRKDEMSPKNALYISSTMPAYLAYRRAASLNCLKSLSIRTLRSK
jgi:hypothetical protein